MSEDLLLYAQLGYADHIRKLVQGGVDPDWRRQDGVTTLMVASLTGRLEIITALVEAGATVDLQAPDGLTALLAATAFARTTRDIAALELLLDLGADPNLANDEGNDALMMASRHGLTQAVHRLLAAGAHPRRANRFGMTALMQAARGHLVETARVLLEAGADPKQIDERGLTALRYAHEIGTAPRELEALLTAAASPSERPPTTAFEEADFALTLLGRWQREPGPRFALADETRQRRVTVEVEARDATADLAEDLDRLAARCRSAVVREGGEATFSDFLVAQIGDTYRARFSAEAASGVFYALTLSVFGDRAVTFTYRDARTSLPGAARGRQAGESVEVFRVGSRGR